MSARPRVELHRRSCKCRGHGFLHYPGGQAFECRARSVITISYEEWERAGRPQVADDYEVFILRAAGRI